MNRLQGKVAIVTGSARGLGAGAAEAMAREGAAVIIADRLDDKGEALAQRLRGEGFPVDYAHLDVTDPEQWAKLVDDTVAKHGRIDCLVNNAGINRGISIDRATLDDFREVMEVNLFGPFLGMKAVLPVMRRNGGGSIINVASNSTQMVLPATAIYGPSKAALANLTKSVAVHCGLKGDNIRVNSIHPGAHDTDMMNTAEAGQSPHGRALMASIPLGRLGKPSEFGQLVVFLASDESSYMTATELFTDGGLTVVSFADPKRLEAMAG